MYLALKLQSSTPLGTSIGAAIGAGVGLLVIVVILVILLRHAARRRRRAKRAEGVLVYDEWEIDPARLTVGRAIGEGQFGQVRTVIIGF